LFFAFVNFDGSDYDGGGGETKMERRGAVRGEGKQRRWWR